MIGKLNNLKVFGITCLNRDFLIERNTRIRVYTVYSIYKLFFLLVSGHGCLERLKEINNEF